MLEDGSGQNSYYLSCPAIQKVAASQLYMDYVGWFERPQAVSSRGHELDTGLPSTVSWANLAKSMREASGDSRQL